jgi:hypothetical protein
MDFKSFGWDDIKKTVARTSHLVAMKAGLTEGTVDEHFNSEYRNFESNQKLIKKTHKDIKRYVELLSELHECHEAVVKDMEQLCETASQSSDLPTKAAKLISALDQSRLAMEKQAESDLVIPITTYLVTYKVMEGRCKERDWRLANMDRFKAEVRHLHEKSYPDHNRIANAQAKLNQATQAYEELNNELIHDLRALHDDRASFFVPIFATFTGAQTNFFVSAATEMSKFQKHVAHIDTSSIHSRPKVITERSAAERDPTPPPSSSETFVGGGKTPIGQVQQQPPPISAATSATASSTTTYQPASYTPGINNPVFSTTTPIGQASALSSSSSSPMATQQPVLPPPVLSRPTPPKPVVAIALYPFVAEAEIELSFQPGDKITILRQEGDWWEGEMNGKRGLLPANYVKILL